MSETRLRVIVLGCGSSGGVPRVGGDWGTCDPNEPRNRRRRCSILLERGEPDAFGTGDVTRVLIDTSPDLREQLLDAAVPRLDAVVFTHAHADQCHGIDDLRALAIAQRARIPVHADPVTAGDLTTRFGYCFTQKPGSPYPPILELNAGLQPGEDLTVEGPGGPITLTPLAQDHGSVDSLGFRVGRFAYSNDVVEMPEATFAALTGLDVWLVDALQPTPHGTHAHLPKTLGWIERLRPKRAVLTNLHVTMDYARINAETPDHVEMAWDGQVIEISLDTS